MNSFRCFETCNTKSIEFSTFIYEVNTFYSLTILILCYVKVSKYIIAICSLVLRRGFLIRSTILVYIYETLRKQ